MLQKVLASVVSSEAGLGAWGLEVQRIRVPRPQTLGLISNSQDV